MMNWSRQFPIALLAFAMNCSAALCADTPATRPSTAPAAANRAPTTQEALLARRALKESTRLARLNHAPAHVALPSADKMMAPAMSSIPLPGRPQMEPGPRHTIQPAPAITARIPNLLHSPRKAAIAANPPFGAPAPAVSTPAVNNVDGTATLSQIPPFNREIQIDVAPPPSVMPFEQEPYLQAPAAPDDMDAPLPTTQPTTRPTMQ